MISSILNPTKKQKNLLNIIVQSDDIIRYCILEVNILNNESKPYIIDGNRVSRDEYNKNKLDSILLRVPKGKKEIIKSYAESKGESVNGFINRIIDKEMELNKCVLDDKLNDKSLSPKH